MTKIYKKCVFLFSFLSRQPLKWRFDLWMAMTLHVQCPCNVWNETSNSICIWLKTYFIIKSTKCSDIIRWSRKGIWPAYTYVSLALKHHFYLCWYKTWESVSHLYYLLNKIFKEQILKIDPNKNDLWVHIRSIVFLSISKLSVIKWQCMAIPFKFI